MKHLVPVSGGKDSQATAIWALNNGIPFTPVFNDVKWESKLTYFHLEYMQTFFPEPITYLTSAKFGGMREMVLKKGRFPSSKARFCTELLKVLPMIDYVLAQTDDVTIYVGVRAQESLARRHLKADDEFFVHYFQPYKYRGKYDKKIAILEKRLAKSKAGSTGDLFGDSGHEKLVRLRRQNERTKKPVYYTYRKKDVIAWCDKYSADVKRPLLKWTTEMVFDYIGAHGQKPNPLYSMGHKRVGCYPCIMETLPGIMHIAQQDPDRIEEIAAFELETDTTFFPPDYIPEAYCTKRTVSKKGVVKMVPTILDVVKYVMGNPDQVALSLPATTCNSPYSLCG